MKLSTIWKKIFGTFSFCIESESQIKVFGCLGYQNSSFRIWIPKGIAEFLSYRIIMVLVIGGRDYKIP